MSDTEERPIDASSRDCYYTSVIEVAAGESAFAISGVISGWLFFSINSLRAVLCLSFRNTKIIMHEIGTEVFADEEQQRLVPQNWQDTFLVLKLAEVLYEHIDHLR